MKKHRTAPVFFDPKGRRWKGVRGTWLGFAVVSVALGGLFLASVFASPGLPSVNLRALTSIPKPTVDKPMTPVERDAEKTIADLRAAEAKGKKPAPVAAPIAPPRPPSGPVQRPQAIGFYVNWDDSSYSSLKRNVASLDVLMPQWAYLQDGDEPLKTDVDQKALDLIHTDHPTMSVVPLLQNYVDEQWNSGVLERAVATDASRARLVASLDRWIEDSHFGGIAIDLEEVPVASQPNLLKFVEALHADFQPHGWVVAQAVPFADDAWNYQAYAAATDELLLMAYDEHWSTGKPGSVAGEAWFERTLAERMRTLSPEKTVVCIGGYGYDWSDDGSEATDITFEEAMLSAHDSEADVTWDASSRNPHFSYDEDDGSTHDVWFLDAVTAYNELRAAAPYNVAGFALWRLGSEDPSVWSVFGSDPSKLSLDGAREIKYGYGVDFEGQGEILQVAAEPQDGGRDITTDDAGYVTTERYTATPSPYVIRKSGYKPGEIALTFDDGPDPTWTPQILDLLKQKGVPATFFILGENGQESPQLVRRIVDEGHDIGNHTFTHPNLGEVPGPVTDLELNATERFVQAVTGRGTILFRAPYFGDAMPQTPDEVDPIVRAQRLGFVSVGLQIDPDDWAMPGADAIVSRTIEGALVTDPDDRGQIVLLHDGGGDRSQTLAALPKIIDRLRARGFTFVTVSQLAGLTRDQAMPPVPPDQTVYAMGDQVMFYALSFASSALHWGFLIGIVLGLGRLAFVGSLAFAQWLRSRRREREHVGEDASPFVSVIVPAYNEEKVIDRTIESILRSTYTNFEIVVVDDGSPDGTSEVVRTKFGHDPRVRHFVKENGGKAQALNYGLAHSTGEIVVALDADTIFEPGTVGHLARRFVDERLGAVAGNAKVGNRLNLVTRLQALEYVTSQNLDRRAFASLNCITVVPGAVGAWRREPLERAGGFSSDTLAEDQDLTLAIRRLGYHVGYEEKAIAWTEAPDTVRSLAKQRFRWSFGTLQCMWKHRDALLRPKYGTLGFVAMPNVWLFQVVFPLVSPAMDLMFLWSFVASALDRLEHPHEYAVGSLGRVAAYYALFLAVDWLAAAFAFCLERREQWSLIGWLFFQRFCYRQVMYWVMVKSVAAALRGGKVGWGSLERKATVAVES